MPLLVKTCPFVPAEPATFKLPDISVICPALPIITPLADVLPIRTVPELSIDEQLFIVDAFIVRLFPTIIRSDALISKIKLFVPDHVLLLDKSVVPALRVV